MKIWEEIADSSFGMMKDMHLEQNDNLERNVGFVIWNDERHAFGTK